MYCPKCGNEMSLFSDKCLSCGMSFKSMSIAQRQKFEGKPPVKNLKRKSKHQVKKSKPKAQTTPIRMTYDNGIAVGEGMSVTGTKQRRGAHRPFLFKY